MRDKEKTAFKAVFSLDDVDDLFVVNRSVKTGLAVVLEGHLARDHGVERMVPTDLHVLSSIDLRSTLANDHHTRTCFLAIAKLHTEVFRIRCV